MTGLEIITKEREEQISKHGYTPEMDSGYINGELIKAAEYCLEPRDGVWPYGWLSMPKYKIAKKSKAGQLACAGAFYMAENKRIGSDLHDSKISEIAEEIETLLNV